MRVFSVEMLVKEEGAAVVQVALNRLKGEAKAVAAEMKVTTSAVTSTGTAMRAAGQATEISGGKAAKAAIGFAAVGQSLARTGSLTAEAGTRIIEAGSNIAMMFGPKGLAAAAILSFVAMLVSKFNEAEKKAQAMREKFEQELKNIANAGDVTGAKERLRDLMYGVGEGAIDATVDLKDGIIAIQREMLRIENLPVGQFMAARGEMRRLRKELEEAKKEYADLQALIFNPRIAARPSLAPMPITFTARAQVTPIGPEALNALPLPKAADILPAIERDFSDLLRVKIPEALTAPMGDLSQSIYGQMASGISDAIEGGITSGFEMALASGNIGDAFKAMGQSIVRSMASAMVRVALAAINFGNLLKSIRTFMMANPALAVASAIALLTLARAMGGAAGGADMVATGGPGGLTYAAAGTMAAPTSQVIFGATSATTAAGMTPRSSTNVTIIGPNDPTAQRAMQELLAKANSRGRIG